MINDLIFKKPEEEGLYSGQILKFLKQMEERKKNLHSFMIVRHGNILAEGYYKPFHKDFQHRLYSASKTVVALAIGKLIGDGKVCLGDKIADFFPEYRDREQHKWLQECTVEDALKMSVPMLTDTYFDRKYKEWAWTFFNRQEALKPAGTVFNYNTSGSFILDVLVEKLTGQTFLEYLSPIFEKIGVSKDIWCIKAPDNFSWGGSGVMATMRDFAKIGELVLHKGEYKGEQLLPRDFMERATSPQISNIEENNYSEMRTMGYGYQIWIHKHGYSLYGMGSQLAICFPDKDFLFVCNGDTQCNADSSADFIYREVKECLYNALDTDCIEDGSYKELQLVLKNLELVKDFGAKNSPFQKEIDGVKYRLEKNVMGWKWLQFDFACGAGVLTYENERGVKKICFGLGEYMQGAFPETHYYDRQVDVPAGRELDALFIANWTEEKKLLLRNYIIDTNFGNCFMTFGFKGNEIGIMMHKRAEFFMDEYQGFAGGERE